jgi:hypothetical protein
MLHGTVFFPLVVFILFMALHRLSTPFLIVTIPIIYGFLMEKIKLLKPYIFLFREKKLNLHFLIKNPFKQFARTGILFYAFYLIFKFTSI